MSDWRDSSEANALSMERYADSTESTAKLLASAIPESREKAEAMAKWLEMDSERPMVAVLAAQLRALRRLTAAVEQLRDEAVRLTGRVQRYRAENSGET